MVEELKLEKVYAQRGIELITPAVGMRILDRLINQRAANVVAITADWNRARHSGLSGKLPSMFVELEGAETPTEQLDSGTSIVEIFAATATADRQAVIAEHVHRVVAAVFDCAASDIAPDDMLEDIGLDSMMAMDFRVRLNSMFSIDIPVLEILQGVSVNSLSERILKELASIHGEAPVAPEISSPDVDDVELLMDDLSDTDLRQLLAELEASVGEPESRRGQS
jgi:acyl carrier protein